MLYPSKAALIIWGFRCIFFPYFWLHFFFQIKMTHKLTPTTHVNTLPITIPIPSALLSSAHHCPKLPQASSGAQSLSPSHCHPRQVPSGSWSFSYWNPKERGRGRDHEREIEGWE